MTAQKLIDKLTALPDEQKTLEVNFLDDYNDTHGIEGDVLVTDGIVFITEYSNKEYHKIKV